MKLESETHINIISNIVRSYNVASFFKQDQVDGSVRIIATINLDKNYDPDSGESLINNTCELYIGKFFMDKQQFNLNSIYKMLFTIDIFEKTSDLGVLNNFNYLTYINVGNYGEYLEDEPLRNLVKEGYRRYKLNKIYE